MAKICATVRILCERERCATKVPLRREPTVCALATIGMDRKFELVGTDGSGIAERVQARALVERSGEAALLLRAI